MIQENIKLFHFYAWSDSYGWQHLGCSDGYNSYDECHGSNLFYIRESGNDEKLKLLNGKKKFWKIMKLIETKKKV